MLIEVMHKIARMQNARSADWFTYNILSAIFFKSLKRNDILFSTHMFTLLEQPLLCVAHTCLLKIASLSDKPDIWSVSQTHQYMYRY